MTDSILQRATNRDSDDEAVAWIAEDRTMRDSVDRRAILDALLRLAPGPKVGAAIAYVTRILADSHADSSSYLFATNELPDPEHVRAVLDMVASRTGGLQNATADDLFNGVKAARTRGVPLDVVYSTLAALIGQSSDELLRRCPSTSPQHWTITGAREIHAFISSVLDNELENGPGGSVPTTALELLAGMRSPGRTGSGWAALEGFRRSGVPYELLLTQRIVGGTWRTHRDATGRLLSGAVLADLTHLLDDARIRYVDLRAAPLTAEHELLIKRVCATAKLDKRFALLVLPNEGVPILVVLATANDGGTARKTAAALARLDVPDGVRSALIAIGLGWVGRNETSQVTETFGANIYTEQSLEQLVADLQ